MGPSTERESLEEEIDQIAQEYEDFAYIVSHDLNAPLRHVREFTRLLIAGRKDNLTEEEQEYVSFLEKSLTKLDDMQQALLVFSRLNTRAGEVREVDTQNSVSMALRELDEVISLYHPAFECKDLPLVMVEPRQFELLFFHLIDNALKFHSPHTVKRKVSISAVDQGDTWLFSVKDNGIGIDKKHHETVFKLFKRLQPEQYPGIGAGLTIAHRIVQRHGGEMLVESDLDQGSTFFFTVPKTLHSRKPV